MANQTLIPPPPQQQDEELHLLPQSTMDESLWTSLKENVRAALFPEKLPPLQLTSRPVKVRDIWGEYNYKKESASVSLVVHIAAIAALIAVSIVGGEAEADGDPNRSRSLTAIADDKAIEANGWRRRRWRRSRQVAGSQGKGSQDRDGADYASCDGHSQ